MPKRKPAAKRSKAPAKNSPVRREKKPAPRKAKPKKKTKRKPPKKPATRGRGRPRIELDDLQLDTIENLAAIHCTNEEIASVVGVSVDTLTRNFAEHIKTGKDKGKASLRRVQWQRAQGGNATMQIWLGKQLLGQKDVVETTQRVEVTEVRWRVVDPPKDA